MTDITKTVDIIYPITVHYGISYFATDLDATTFATNNGTPVGSNPARDFRLVQYQLGWAIQHGYSGGYIGPDDLRPARWGEDD